MDDIEIRKSMLNLATRKRIKDLSISIGGIDILNCVSMGFKTSGQISKELGVKVNSISTRLKTLRKKGYLSRVEVASVTGGLEYECSNIYKIGD